jgi:hypothetical protein
MADVGQVSTNIYQPLQPPNQGQMQPLDVIRMIGGLQENQIRQRNMDALQGIGGAYNRNISPTGDINVSGLRSDIARNGGVLAGEGLSQATANSDADLKLRSSWQQTLRGIYGQLGTQPSVTDDDLAAAKVAAAGAGIPPAAIQQFVSTMPRAKSSKDVNARRQWLVTQGNLAQNPETVAQGTEGPIDASGVRPQISRGRAAYEMAGVGSAPGQPGMRTNLPVGSGAALERSAADITALRSKNTSYPNDMVAINGLIHSLKAVGDKGSGPGTSELNTLKSALYSNFSWVPGVEKAVGDPQVMADYASGEKYAKQLATSLADNIGPGTNQGLTTAFGSSPNMNISNLAGTQLAKTLYGVRNLQQATQIAFDKTGLPENQFHRWSRDWSTKVNPAGFMWDQLDDKEQDRVLKKIDDNPKTARAERAKLNASIHQAVSSGLMADPFAKAGQ